MKTRYKKVFARALSAVLSAAMLLSSAVTAFAATETTAETSSQNEFDFEDNSLSEAKYNEGYVIAEAPGEGHGNYSLKKDEHTGNGNKRFVLNLNTNLVKDHEYIFDFYYYYIPSDNEVTSWFSVFTGIYSQLQSTYKAINSGFYQGSENRGKWINAKVSYTVQYDCDYLEITASTGGLYVDDIRIIDVTGVENTLTNATFEDYSVPSGITLNSVYTSLADAPGEGHGNYSVKTRFGIDSNAAVTVNKTFEGGKTYYISFSCWHVSNAGGSSQWFAVCNPSHSQLYNGDWNAGYDKWVDYSFTYSPTDTVNSIYFLFNSSTVYLDDIKIIDVSSVVNTVENVTFETGGRPAGVSGGSIVSAPASGHGNFSLKSAEGGTRFIKISKALKANVTYRITFYCYFVSGSSTSTWFRFDTFKGTDDPVEYTNRNTGKYNEWIKYTIDVVPKTDCDGFSYLFNGCTVYLDDITTETVSNPTQDNLYVATDFSDYETNSYLLAGVNVPSFEYKTDETLGKTVAVASINGPNGDGKINNLIAITYALKANTKYYISMSYKSDGFACLAYKGAYNGNETVQNNGNYGLCAPEGTGGVYENRTFVLTPGFDTILYISSTQGNSPTLSISSLVVKEVVSSSTNTASKQVYEFDSTVPVNAKGYNTALVKDKDGNLTEALNPGDAGFALDYALTAGKVYKLSYDYKGSASFRVLPNTDPNGWGGTAGMYSADKVYDSDSDKTVNSDEWKSYSTYFEAQNNSTHIRLFTTASTNFFLDNIVIEEVTLTPGDMDGSGVIDASDITALRKVLLGVNDPLIIDWAGNISNAKGESTGVDIRDLVALKKKIAGIEPAATPATYTAQNYATAEAAVRLTTDSNSDIEAGVSTFSLAPSDQVTSENGTTTYSYNEDGYIVFKLNGSITEGAVEYDISAYKLGDLDIEVSPDGINYTNENITPQDISGERINDGWVRYTAYYKFDSAEYIKINFPKELGGNMRIRKVRLNGCDAQTLYNMHGFNSSLRAGKTVYVSSGGSSENDGTDINNPTTIDAAFSRMLAPGDKILLKSGDTFSCTGGVKVLSSGTEDNPIYIGSYGDGAKPIIADFTGVGLTLTGENITVENIAFTSPSGKTGIKAFALCGESKNLTVKNCKFYNINTNSENGSHSRDTGGTAFLASGNNPSWFNGITVENNEYDSIARGAFFASSDWCARDTSQNDGIDDWGNKNLVHKDKLEKTEYPILGIVVKNNSINKCGGDAINVIGTKGALLEYNTVADSKLFYNNTSGNIAFASIWCHSSDDCVIQYNEVYGNSSANKAQDLQAFDIDIGCNNCIVQYNYSHNNAGGFMLLCGGDGKNNGQVTGSIVRYNLSVNDGYDNENKKVLQVIDITGTVRNSQIYNNTIYCGKNTRAVNFSNYGNYSESSSNTVFTNNIFYAADGVEVTWGYQTGANNTNNYAAMQSASFDHNLFYNISEPTNTNYGNKVTVTNSTSRDPEFSDPQEVNGRLEAIKHFYVGKGNDVIGHAAAVVNKNIADYEGNTITHQNPILGAVYHAYTTAD